MAAKQGFLMYYSKGDAIGTRVSVRYRRSGRLSEVVVKRGSTVLLTHTQSHIISVIFQQSADQNVSMADVQVLTGAHVSLAGVVHPVRQVR